MNIFTDCAKCGTHITQGDQFYSVSLSRDLVESDTVIEPLVAESPAVWCLKCGPDAVRAITGFTNDLIGHVNDVQPGTGGVTHGI